MTCKHIRKDGSHCRAYAQCGSDFCIYHDPKKREKLRAAQARGGKGRRRQFPDGLAPMVTIDFENPEPALAVICGAVTSLGRGELDAKTGHAMFHGIEAACRLYQISAIANIKTRQERIQRLLEAEWNRPVDKAEVERLLRFEPEPAVEIETDLIQSDKVEPVGVPGAVERLEYGARTRESTLQKLGIIGKEVRSPGS